MRKAWALTIGALVLLAGCGGRDDSRRAERAQPASATEATTSTSAAVTWPTAVEPTTSVVTVAPASGADRYTQPMPTNPSGNASSPPYGGSVAPGEPSPDGPPRPPSPQPAPPPYPYPAPSQPEPRPPCCKNPNAVRWESYAASPDGRTLTFKYWSGVDACSRFDRADVRESPSQVVVTIYERDVTNGNPCIAMAQEKFATVTLSAPLGGRTVVDGAA